MWKNKLIVKPKVISDIGEVLYSGSTYTVRERTDSPFRSITDLKGYDDAEINAQPSDTDVSGYVDNRVVIDKIMRNVPLDVLSIYTDRAFRDTGSDSDIAEDNDYDAETEDIADIATSSGDLAEAIAEASAKVENKHQSAGVDKEQALARDAETTA